MRKDIQINTATNDMILQSKGAAKKYSFKWLEEKDLYLTAQITIPSSFNTNLLYTV